MGRTTERFSRAEPAAIASAKLMELHFFGLNTWMRSVEHWRRYLRKEAFTVLPGLLFTIKAQYAGG